MTVLASYHDDETKASSLLFKNDFTSPMAAIWVEFDGSEKEYAFVQPGTSYSQATFTTHAWRMRADGRVLGNYVGPSAQLRINPAGKLEVSELPKMLAVADVPPDPKWGQYRQRGEALGMVIKAYDCVCDEAVQITAHVVTRMLECSPPEVAERLIEGGACVAIIGKDQVTSDIPEHAYLRNQWQDGDRDLDATTRGLSGTAANPTTSCGEENIIMVDDNKYAEESILVHEFGHCVMHIGLTQAAQDEIHRLYKASCINCLYDKDCYMASNADEYWAEGTQAWFDASVRCDVNDSVNTRQRLRDRDPALAAVMERVYGDGPWRYTHDSPAQFSCRPHRAKDHQVAVTVPMVKLAKKSPRPTKPSAKRREEVTLSGTALLYVITPTALLSLQQAAKHSAQSGKPTTSSTPSSSSSSSSLSLASAISSADWKLPRTIPPDPQPSARVMIGPDGQPQQQRSGGAVVGQELSSAPSSLVSTASAVASVVFSVLSACSVCSGPAPRPADDIMGLADGSRSDAEGGSRRDASAGAVGTEGMAFAPPHSLGMDRSRLADISRLPCEPGALLCAKGSGGCLPSSMAILGACGGGRGRTAIPHIVVTKML